MSVVVTATALNTGEYVADSNTLIYEVPSSTRTIIDKFTANNASGASATLTVYLVPNGQSVGAQYMILDGVSIADAGNLDITQAKNHVLETGGRIYCISGTNNAISVRVSGRQVVTS